MIFNRKDFELLRKIILAPGALINSAGAARKLGCSERHAIKLIKTKKLMGVRIGRGWLLNANDLKEIKVTKRRRRSDYRGNKRVFVYSYRKEN